MRGVGGAEGEIGEEGPVGSDRCGVVHELDGLVDEVLGEVVAVGDRAGRVDAVVVVDEIRRELVGLPVEEPVEAVEAALQRPLVERPGRRCLVHGAEVPLAEREGGVPLVAQDLAHRRGLVGDLPSHVREAAVEVGHRPHADAVMVAAREQRGARRRAERRDVEVRVAQTTGGQSVDVRSGDVRPEATEVGEAEVVQQDHDHVRRVVAGVGRGRPPRRGVVVRGADRSLPFGRSLRHHRPPPAATERRTSTHRARDD